MSTRSGRIKTRTSVIDTSPPRTRPSRSPARVRKSSPIQKSPPARQSGRKSPARKSPSRKTPSKFPARKSPARTTKEQVEPAPEPPKSPLKRRAIKSEVSVRLEDLTTKFEIRSTRSKRTEYSAKDIKSTKSEIALEKTNGIEPNSGTFGIYLKNRSVDEAPPRRSSRLREFIGDVPDLLSRRSISKSASENRSESKSISKSVSKSMETYSDGENSADDLIREKSNSATRKLSTPLRNTISNMKQIMSRLEFGGQVGCFALILLIPLTVLSILTSCMKSCSFATLLSFSPFKSSNLWFSIPSFVTMIIQLFVQAVFTVLPIFGHWGDRFDGSNTRSCFNALFALLCTMSLLYGLGFSGVINLEALLSDYLRLATASYIFAVILSFTLYVNSGKLNKSELNPHGNTGHFLYDFFIGREIHPQIKSLDVKIWISRISNISTLILASLIFSKGIKLQWNDNEAIDMLNYKELLTKVQMQPTILVFSLMQIVYILSFIAKEYKIATTFYWHSEGLGYMQIVSSSLYPFYFTTLTKYVADTDLLLSTNILISASVIFTLGLCLMLASNNIKYEFRRNPLQPCLANLESMPTFHGNKLITSGLWGILRHPNYTGDIIIHLVLALPGILSGELIAASPALITILILLHRAWRDHSRCKWRYGAAWQRYCTKVPSLIIPNVL